MQSITTTLTAYKSFGILLLDGTLVNQASLYNLVTGFWKYLVFDSVVQILHVVILGPY